MKSIKIRHFYKHLLLILLAILCISIYTCCTFNSSNKTDSNDSDKNHDTNSNLTTATPVDGSFVNGEIKITFLDVGQGDSAFIEFDNGKTMLIDASVSKAGDDIVSYISSKGYNKIDYLVATHPHADHIGGMKAVVEAFDLGEIYMPRASTNTKTYENLLQAIQDKGMKIKGASAGMNICDGVEILAPNSESYDEMNDYSVVIKINYGNTDFLFTGDAENLSENEILNAGFDVSADVVKVGHHGSGTSSSQAFVDATKADYAIISVGEDNNYNHPHQFIVERWEASGAKVIRTDISGNIYVVSDGQNISVNTEK